MRTQLGSLAGALCLATACTTAPGPTIAETVPDLKERVGAPLPAPAPWDEPSTAWDGKSTLTGPAVLATALQNNRALRKTLAVVDARRAVYQDSQLPPNPTISLGGGIPLDMGVAPLLAMLSVQVDWLWKREALIGQSDAALRSALFEAAALTVATAVEARSAYIHAGSAWEVLILSLRDVEIATSVLNAESAALEAGATSAEALNAARMNQSEASARAMEAHRAVDSAKLHLLSVMGRGDLDTLWMYQATTAQAAAEECAFTPTVPPLDHAELQELVRARRLDIVAANARVAGAQQRVALAKASQWSVMAEGGYERDMTGDSAIMLAAQVTVPIFNQGQFRVRAAEAELEVARIDADALWQSALLETRDALGNAGVADHHMVELRDNSLKPFDATMALLKQGVEAGEIAPLRMWLTEHQENHLRVRLAEAQRDRLLAALEIERALAGAGLPQAQRQRMQGMSSAPLMAENQLKSMTQVEGMQ